MITLTNLNFRAFRAIYIYIYIYICTSIRLQSWPCVLGVDATCPKSTSNTPTAYKTRRLAAIGVLLGRKVLH